MKPHQHRVVSEKQELDHKISSLDSFIGGAVFAELADDEQDRLVRQHRYMTQYSAVLGERISHFEADQ